MYRKRQQAPVSLIQYITENKQNTESRKTVYDSLMAVMVANADSGDDMEIVTSNLVKQVLVDLSVTALVSVFLEYFASFWIKKQ